MASEDMIKLSGKVVDRNRDVFKVEVNIDPEDSSKTITIDAKPGGRMRMNFIKILEGDTVDIEMSPYDTSKGRITYRHK